LWLRDIIMELKRPTNIVAVAIFILGQPAAFGISYFFYVKGSSRANIVYSFEQNKVFDSSSVKKYQEFHTNPPISITTSPITIFDKSGNAITNNLYSATLSAWNAGNTTIHLSDIRRRYKIVLDNSDAHVIESSLDFATNGNADRFSFDPNDQQITWENFDPDDGFRVSILYSAKSPANLTLKGYIVGSPKVISLQDYRQFLELIDVKFVLLCLIIYTLLCTLFVALVVILSKKFRGIRVLTHPVVASGTTIVLVMVLLQLLRVAGDRLLSNSPPF
jgi:hypothetical protein